MATEENKALVRRLVDEVWNRGNLAAMDELLSDDYMHHDPASSEIRSRDEFRDWIRSTLTGFPDFHVELEDMVAEGDRVATRWTVTGTHSGELYSPLGNIPPTGKKVRLTGITINRVRGGKIAEDWHYGDMMGFMLQLGLMPPPGSAV